MITMKIKGAKAIEENLLFIVQNFDNPDKATKILRKETRKSLKEAENTIRTLTPRGETGLLKKSVGIFNTKITDNLKRKDKKLLVLTKVGYKWRVTSKKEQENNSETKTIIDRNFYKRALSTEYGSYDNRRGNERVLQRVLNAQGFKIVNSFIKEANKTIQKVVARKVKQNQHKGK